MRIHGYVPLHVFEALSEIQSAVAKGEAIPLGVPLYYRQSKKEGGRNIALIPVSFDLSEIVIKRDLWEGKGKKKHLAGLVFDLIGTIDT
ncbi:MAG: hypothetical protein COT24_00350 [Candidatus Kerfeldbacteria bacterium CG08_land_8_20_14_0_20_40_16]|uniref:Uncharacterized protein n=1 Tax=Candidatus Kerfeldbacteria bacterium CG08_land_8_20_14_0_20_40_16 TaxID=2014244 RepID=A0A2H0YXM8_9BACT|nr:MAG: hypothetical protein COT24_00350 [Candidatus Kerfeldbacteria bacterium CG08_land_8_20_14_0_20_40_16]